MLYPIPYLLAVVCSLEDVLLLKNDTNLKVILREAAASALRFDTFIL